MVKQTRAPGTPATTGAPAASHPVGSDDSSGRPHLFAIAMGALDAHLNQVDFFDTVGGKELLRLYRRRHAVQERRKDRHGTGKRVHQAA